MSFTPFRRSNHCPLCDSDDGRCREADTVILCMSLTDAFDIPGYRFIGLTKDKLWGKWVQDNGQTWTEQQRQQWKNEQQAKRQLGKQQEAQRRANAMPAIERDRLYRELLGSLTLHPTDRAEIETRLRQIGFPENRIASLIENWGVKSVQQWQQLDIKLPHTLPGVNPNGRSLNTPCPGYLCPIRDSNGLITALQVRTQNPQPDAPKYYWLTSATKRCPNGATSHLPSGELPLSIFLPQKRKRPWIGIAEGIGAKPFIASERLGIPVIGAAGGQWASSPEFFQQAIKGNLESHPMIVLLPDAGQYDAKHKSVIDRYRATWKLCCKLGCEFRVLWWEQFDKSIGDVDEISDEKLRTAELLTFAQFESVIHRNEQPLEKVLSLLHKWGGRKKKQRQQQAQQPQEDTNIHYYQPGDRLKTWQAATEQGHQYILDRSEPGTGKSFTAGQVQPELLGTRQAIYLSSQHRNPTTDTMSEWVDLEARHAGLVQESTVNGKSRLRRTKRGETPTVVANCNRTNLINTLRLKNINGADTSTVICRTCPLREACTNAEGAGYGFLNQRRSALSSPLLRAHPDSAPSPLEYAYDEVGLIWEEFGEAFTVKKVVKVSLKDLEQITIALLPYPDLSQSLQPLLSALLPYLDGSDRLPRFGLNHAELVQRLPVPAVDFSPLQMAIDAKLQFVNSTAEQYGVDLADLPPALRRKFTDPDSQLAEQAEQQVIKQWLPDLLQILTGDMQGASIRVDHHELLLTLPDQRHRKIAHAAKVNIILDATLSREDLALKLDCKPEEIFVCAQRYENPNNLTITQVTDLGRMGMYRGNDQERRAAAIVSYYKAVDPTTKVIDFKKFGADAAWWRDSRGVNDFLQVRTLILIGTPCRNLAELLAEYTILTGQLTHEEDTSFKAWVNRIILADIHQAIGRLRANRRLNEQLRIIFISDFPIDLPVQEVKASDITLDAATTVETAWAGIVEAVKRFWHENGELPTQTAVATETGFSQSWISKLAAQFIGGWRSLGQLIDSLMMPPDQSSTDTPSTEETWVAQWLEVLIQDPSVEIARHLNTLLQTFGWQGWQRILTQTTPSLRLQLLAALFRDGVDAEQALFREQRVDAV